VDPVSRKVDNQSLRDEVTRGYREGKTRDALALEFDVHRVTVANWLQESGDRQKKVKPESVSLTQEQRAEIIRQHTAGASQQAIAKEFGILSSRVSKIVVKAAGKEPQKRRAPVKLTPEQVAEIQRRYAAGDGQRNIAKDFEIDQTRVSDIVRGQDRTTRGGPKMNRPDRLTPEQRVEVEQRLRSQESQTDIARDFDVSQAVISMIKLKAGIETRAQRGPRTTLPPLTDEQRAEILRRLAAGERQVVIAEALGTTQGRVSSVKREAGL
jgi:transposase